MPTESTRPNRDEYFDQLIDKAANFLETQLISEEEKLKGDILGITFDKCEELMKRVEELEAACIVALDHQDENIREIIRTAIKKDKQP